MKLSISIGTLLGIAGLLLTLRSHGLLPITKGTFSAHVAEFDATVLETLCARCMSDCSLWCERDDCYEWCAKVPCKKVCG
jgi:hypothetical protein